MGLLEKAYMTKASGLKEKSAFYKHRFEVEERKLKEKIQEESSENLEDKIFKKEYQLQTVLEISQEIYRTLDPNELMNIFLLTFMGQSRSSKGAFLLKEGANFQLTVAKGIDEGDLLTVSLDSSLKEVQDLRSDSNTPIDIIFPVMGKQEVLGFILLSKTGIQNIEQEEEVFAPLLSLGGIALENALLYDDIQTKFNQLQALYQIGETLNQSPDLHEVLFLAFSTLEYGLGIQKLLLLLKNENEDYTVFDGYGCTEETHKNFKIEKSSELENLLEDKKAINLLNEEGFNPASYFSERDLEELDLCFSIPLKIYGENIGYLVILKTLENSDVKWHEKLYELVASYFASSIYLIQKKDYQKEDSFDLKALLLYFLNEQIDFAQKMDYEIAFAVSPSLSQDAKDFLLENKVKYMPLFFGHYLLTFVREEKSLIEAEFAKAETVCTLKNKAYADESQDAIDIVEKLGL